MLLPNGGVPIAGTTSLTTTAVAALSSTGRPCKMVLVQNDPDNTVDVLVGDASSQTIQLKPGDPPVWVPVSDVSLLSAKNVSSATQTINWLAII